MTRTTSKIALSIGLSAALALPSLLTPSTAFAGETSDDPTADPATSAPVVVVAPPPAPAPPPPPAPTVSPTVAGTGAPSPVIIDPRVAHLRHQRNSGMGMAISGFTMFGTTYLISALIGTISLDYAEDVGGSGTYGKRMLIPVAGPFMAIPRADSATGGLFTGLMGVAQIGGLVLGTAGAVRFGRANRQLALSASSGGLQLQF
ncbi:hypothetical protein PPSIR1_07987 [Plesiocystis pacifica SIR-1]|uniref:Uncharacterized protein n=1 Tax=Plesiocystis pacifica SIR-1 TaxID=391625 RepID=A6GG27_9BACT|nr:hypothetical protein [Plesiocystis pacifica]EDM75155.1 hypothetical protein PPSIR1_07987 [Plesiocystis pacifica SIR-1]